jgi:signal transduction histidine kinase
MIRAKDWSATGLGAIDSWSDTLRTVVSSVLDNRFEMILLWGPQLLQIYNDAYARLMRDKHPAYLGRPTQECWPEVWHFNAPIYERVMTQGESVYLEDQPYRLQLDGGERVLSLSICYSPVRGPHGDILGVLVTLTDVTRRVQAEQALARDLKSMTRLNDLVARLVHAQDLDSALHEVLDAAISLMDADKGNIQLFDARHQTLRIAAQRGFDEGFLRYFSEVDGDHESACGRALRLGHRVVIPDLTSEPLSSPLRRVADETGYRAVQSTPLLGQNGSPMGMLSTHWRQPTQPSEQALRMLDLYARQAAQFIERSRIEHRLRQTAEELRQASRAKDEFIAMLGHELRNPLAPIQIALHLMEMRGDIASQRERAIIGRQVHHMTRLIDDLLDVARIIRGHVTLQPVPTELRSMVDKAVETAAPLIEQRRHALSLEVPPTGLKVMADPVRLAQVISNVLINAARYTPPEGQIRVTAVAGDDGEVTLSVIDNGMGISQNDLKRVFEVFTQGRQGLDRSQGGLGLGLTIARTMATMHGGTLTAHSDGPDQGSRFDLTLPLLTTDDEDNPSRAGGQQSAPLGTGQTVLIVDDNEDAAHMLSELLTRWGYAVIVAHDGPSGLDLISDRHVDLALLDIGLPVMDGYELAQAIHAVPRHANTPLVALTGYGQDQDRRRAKDAGFSEHLVKPVDIERLGRLLTHLQLPVN